MLLHFFRRILRAVIQVEVRVEINPLRIIPVYAENIYFKHHAVNSIYEKTRKAKSTAISILFLTSTASVSTDTIFI